MLTRTNIMNNSQVFPTDITNWSSKPELITSEQASKLLLTLTSRTDCKEIQRSLKPRITSYAKQMVEGHFNNMSVIEIIELNGEELVSNGLQRLSAQAQCGENMWYVVLRGQAT